MTTTISRAAFCARRYDLRYSGHRNGMVDAGDGVQVPYNLVYYLRLRPRA